MIYGIQFLIYMVFFTTAWKTMKDAINNYILFVFLYMGLGQLVLCVNSSLLAKKGEDAQIYRLIALTIEFVTL